MSSRSGTDRAILSVIGPHSGCGKTLLVTWLVRRIKGLGCLKISPFGEGAVGVPGGDERAGADFYLEEATVLRCARKDTAAYLEAGATQVEWLRHRGEGLAAGLHAALERFGPSVPVVVESSRAAELLRPAAVVLVVRPPIREMKPATRAVLPLVTDLLVNGGGQEALAATEAERLRREFRSLAPRYTWSADLIREPPPEAMVARLGGLLAPRASGSRTEA